MKLVPAPVFALLMISGLAPGLAHAHGMKVVASTDCDRLLVEATFSNGKAVPEAQVEVRGGDNQPLATLPLVDGIAEAPFHDLDHSGGLLVLINTDGHDDFWILTPADIAERCNG